MIGLTVARDVLLLIALGIGYLVLYFAKREEGRLQILGYFISGLILTLAGLYMISDVILQNKLLDARMNRVKRYKNMMMQHEQAPPLSSRPAKAK